MIKILDKIATPIKGTLYSAGVDLFAREEIKINQNEVAIIKLGICIDEDLLNEFILKQYHNQTQKGSLFKFIDNFKKNYYLSVKARSSLALKTGLIIANGEGVIDLDYRDEIGIIVYATRDITVLRGDKVAQMIFMKHENNLLPFESEAKREGGFGSTDKKEVETDKNIPDFFKCKKVM